MRPITATVRPVKGPHKATGMPRAFSVTLHHHGRDMRVSFGQGAGHVDAPTVADVLECLASDAATYDQADRFDEDWARDYGYDPDSRDAERTYRAVKAQTERFRALLGEDYDAVVYADQEA